MFAVKGDSFSLLQSMFCNDFQHLNVCFGIILDFILYCIGYNCLSSICERDLFFVCSFGIRNNVSAMAATFIHTL